MIYSDRYLSPLGELLLAGDEKYLLGAWFEGQKYYRGTVKGPLTERTDLPLFVKVSAWLDQYFAGQQPAIAELPIAPRGTDFQQSVWKFLGEIPYGEVVTYGELAVRMARKMGRDRMSAQAVGGAVGHNPISVIIPCHRVVGSGGSLTGYAGGIDKKRWLLKHEGQVFVKDTGGNQYDSISDKQSRGFLH